MKLIGIYSELTEKIVKEGKQDYKKLGRDIKTNFIKNKKYIIYKENY